MNEILLPKFEYLIANPCLVWFCVFGLFIFFAYKKFDFLNYFLAIAAAFLILKFSLFSWILLLAISATLWVPVIRRRLLTKKIVQLIKNLGLLPKISETEKIALTSGTTWVDAELFSGNPDFKKISSQKYPELSSEEKSFLDNEVEKVCEMCVDYEVQKLRDLPAPVWQFLREKKFFGMIIPKKYGGLGFSAYAHSCVIEKLASRSVPLAITAMVPNSLGPSELLLHYGTKDQQDYYLPRLADGRELPCFALTEPNAGSDATSIISNGILFKNKEGEINIRLNWNKRYITLGAYATLIGVAFQLYDPENLISDKKEIGITCALIPNATSGVRQGRRHDPLATPFINSPLNGENVVVGLDAVIGGKNGVGKGWKMLMECLSAGRGISLPSTSSGGSKLVARVASAHSAVREQFGAAIGKFEGVEEVLARIASRTYALDAMRSFTAAAVDSGAKPAVISAIAKYHGTEIFRQNINDGMDILGGSGIIRGSRNVLANAYFSTPISITVEGSNIMTRSLIQFGQGAIMSHPYAFKEINALESNNLREFDAAFFAHIGHLLSNIVRSVLLSLTRGYLIEPRSKDFCIKYQRKITWCSATFAVLADIAMAKFGGNLKRKEKLNGRFGDVLSAMYIAVCILQKFKANGNQESELALAEHGLKEQLNKAQIAIEGIYQNLFGKIGKILTFPFAIWARFNSFSCPSSDILSHKIAKELIKNGDFRNNLTRGIYVNSHPNDNLGRIEHAMQLKENCAEISLKIKQAIKDKVLPKKPLLELCEEALSKSIISLQEKHALENMLHACLDAVQVDEYSLEDYKNAH